MNARLTELLLMVSIMGVSTALLGAQPTLAPPAATPAPTNAPGPRIQFDAQMYDFGRVKAGEPVKHTYIFTNTGDALLIIHSVNPGCGCTTVGEWTKQAEPGKTGSIPIQFNTMGYGGQVFKQPTITCNVTNQPTVFLQLKGTVYKPYDVIPPLAILNLAPDAETASVVMTVTNNTEDPLFVFSAESNNRMLAPQLVTNQPGKAYQLTVSTVPPLATGSIQAQITLKTSWTNTPVIPVTVVVNVQPAVMVIPAYLTLAPGPLPNAVTNSVAIQNNSTNRLELWDAVVNVPSVTAQLKETQPGKAFNAMLTFPQGFQVQPGQQVELTVRTSNPKFPQVKVPVMQMPRPPMSAQASLPAPVPAVAPVQAVRPGPVVVPVPPAPGATSAPAATPPPVKRTALLPPRPLLKPPPLPPLPPPPPAR